MRVKSVFLETVFHDLTLFRKGKILIAEDFNYIVDLASDCTYPRKKINLQKPMYTEFHDLRNLISLMYGEKRTPSLRTTHITLLGMTSIHA